MQNGDVGVKINTIVKGCKWCFVAVETLHAMSLHATPACMTPARVTPVRACPETLHSTSLRWGGWCMKFVGLPIGGIVDDVIRDTLVFRIVANNVVIKTGLPSIG